MRRFLPEGVLWRMTMHGIWLDRYHDYYDNPSKIWIRERNGFGLKNNKRIEQWR
jgi:hypothetical protein